MPSSAPTAQAEFGSGDLAMFFYVVLSIPRLSLFGLPDARVNVLSEYPLSCLRIFTCTVKVPSLMHLQSHINRCCQVSPNMLSKHHQFWGSYTCQVSPNVLSKYQQFWGSHVNSGLSGFSLYCQSTFLSCMRMLLVLSKYYLDALEKSHQPLLPGVSKYAVKAPSILRELHLLGVS